jgi:hypothetical protein
MKTLTTFAIVALLGTAVAANAEQSGPRKHGLLKHRQHQTRQIQKPPADDQPEKPAVTRLPVPPDTFRA